MLFRFIALVLKTKLRKENHSNQKEKLVLGKALNSSVSGGAHNTALSMLNKTTPC